MGAIAVPERPAMWLGHYSLPLLRVAVAVSVADDAAGQPGGADGWAGWIVTAAWAVWIAAVLADGGVHQERLCERCVAATPLDPQAAVDRWKRALRLHHNNGARNGMLGGILACWLATGFLHHPPAWALALSATADVAYGAFSLVSWKHRRLFPWCPFCRWGDGGAEEVSPDVPAPAVSR